MLFNNETLYLNKNAIYLQEITLLYSIINFQSKDIYYK
jgi:hypothetical protein